MGGIKKEKVDPAVNFISAIIKNLDLKVTVIDILQRSMTKKNHCGDLTTLDLSGLGITELLDDSIPEIKTLEGLYLMSNPIEKIEENFLSKLINLKTLNLHNCNIMKIPDKSFNKSKSIQSLVLSNNKITILPSSIARLNELKDLIVSNNQIKNIDELMINNLRNLKILDLQHNEIESLPENTEFLLGLEQLKLKGNSILNIFNSNYEGTSDILSFLIKYYEFWDPDKAKQVKLRGMREKLKIVDVGPKINKDINDTSITRIIIYFLCYINTFLPYLEPMMLGWFLVGIILIPFTFVATFVNYRIPKSYVIIMLCYFILNIFWFVIVSMVFIVIGWIPLLPFLFLILNKHKIDKPIRRN